MKLELFVVKGYANTIRMLVFCGFNGSAAFVSSPDDVPRLGFHGGLYPVGFPREDVYTWDGALDPLHIDPARLKPWTPSPEAAACWFVQGNQYSPMSDDELERLKNVEVDFSRVLKAATEVDPAKVDAKEPTGLRAAVSRLGSAAYGADIAGRIGPEQYGRLKDAIEAAESVNQDDIPYRGKVEHVIMQARMLLAKLDRREKVTGAVALATECEHLAVLLPD